MSARHTLSAVAPAAALAVLGAGVGVWLAADWLIGAALTVHYRRSRSTGQWVWR